MINRYKHHVCRHRKCRRWCLQSDVWNTENGNHLASVEYSLPDTGLATNEIWMVSGSMATVTRSLDGQGRILFNNGMHFSYSGDGKLLCLSNEIAKVEYQYSSDRLEVGYVIELASGQTFSRNTVRDTYRRGLLMNISSTMNGSQLDGFSYTYDALNRPLVRNSDAFGYNERSEVTDAVVSGLSAEYGYDEIGNSTSYTANSLNQYTQFQYDQDGNLLSDGIYSFAYDSSSRLKTVVSNGVLLVTNYYDAKSRHVKKVTPAATTIFFYDDWNLIEERIAYANGATSIIHYYWGKDISGELQGAGGGGGLLYQTIDGAIYIPCLDNNGNITRYLDANGNTVAQYTYDAFGGTLSQSGSLASFFRHRFSTKYLDVETGLYYYGYRFYLPPLMRWLSRDPIGERGGLSLYAFCENDALESFDSFGENRYITQFDILNLGGSGGTQMHVGVAVDDWVCRNGKWVKVGVVTFDFGPEPTFLNMLKTVWKAKGVIDETYGLALKAPITIKSTPQQDIKMLKMIREEKKSPPFYNGAFHNCVFWSVGAINYGM